MEPIVPVTACFGFGSDAHDGKYATILYSLYQHAAQRGIWPIPIELASGLIRASLLVEGIRRSVFQVRYAPVNHGPAMDQVLDDGIPIASDLISPTDTGLGCAFLVPRTLSQDTLSVMLVPQCNTSHHLSLIARLASGQPMTEPVDEAVVGDLIASGGLLIVTTAAGYTEITAIGNCQPKQVKYADNTAWQVYLLSRPRGHPLELQVWGREPIERILRALECALRILAEPDPGTHCRLVFADYEHSLMIAVDAGHKALPPCVAQDVQCYLASLAYFLSITPLCAPDEWFRVGEVPDTPERLPITLTTYAVLKIKEHDNRLFTRFATLLAEQYGLPIRGHTAQVAKPDMHIMRIPGTQARAQALLESVYTMQSVCNNLYTPIESEPGI